MSTRSRTRGVTLVELIVFMVIVGVAMAGIFAAFSIMTKGSADPQVRKQVLAIAESMMEEIVLMPLTYCDPDDPLAATAANAAACTTREDTPIGNESETRYSTTARFDNVSDYHGFVMDPTNPVGTPGIRDVTGMDVREARGRNKRVRLVASASRHGGKVTARVEPELLDHNDPLAGLVDLNNALYLTTDLLGEIGIVQRSGSLTQTAYALLSDLSRICQRLKEI